MLNRRFWDALVFSLQSSIIEDITSIEKFSIEAMETLRKQPQSVEEIGIANQKHNEYEKQAPEMMEMFQNADRKNRILAAWTREHVDQVTRVTAIWDNFSSMMENHEIIISKQVEAIKATLMTQVKNVNGEIDKFKMRWDQLKPKDDTMQSDQSKIIQGIAFIKEKRSELDELTESKRKIINDCAHFGIPEPEFINFDVVSKDLEKHETMWKMFEDFNREMEEMTKEEWIIFRSKIYKFEDHLSSWSNRLKSQDKATTVTVKLIQEVEKFRQVLPIMKYVRGDIFSDHHWTEMYGILGIGNKKIDQLTFGDFLKVKEKIIAKEKDLQELNNRAAGEVVIREALSELDLWEVEAKFAFAEHQATNGDKIPLIKEWKDVVNKVGDNQVLLQSIKGSPYYDAFGERAVVWERKLTGLDEILHNLNIAQRKWVSLEPYQEQMKLNEQTGGFNYREVFKRIDDDFRLIMGDAYRDNRVVSLLKIGSVKSMLNTMLERLERCQKSLNEFLEQKRSSFPRFYFLGDEDLLQILGQASKPAIIQTHLKKLFAGIHSVNFDPSGKHITTMNSLQGEVVPLKNPIRVSSEVEAWLNDLSKEMKSTLKHLLVECVKVGRKNDGSLDPLKYPSQVLCLAESVLFAEKCEAALKSKSLEKLLKLLEGQLDTYTSVDFEEDKESKVLELKLKALILDTIHHIDIVKKLLNSKVWSVDHWLWQKQLRFYLVQDGLVKIRMVNAEFDYTYEYQGNAMKLVHTDLTDKCYLTLTQGMKMGLGGNPYGPAGTGKTESVKALGGLFGRQVLVFNCDEGIDIKSMGRTFVGLVKSGAWGCFDEFNRLAEQTLSVVSMQIQPIQSALKLKLASVVLMNQEISLDTNSGIFVTMNPAGKGYGGRQKLPDNLKQLFRPVVMSQPDSQVIAEVFLFSEGFKKAEDIAKKLIGLFRVSGQLLSNQQHYDWGLRSIVPVLKSCGTMLRKMKTNKSFKSTTQTESEIVVNSLRVNIISRLTFFDNIKFDEILRDTFPGVEFNNAGYEQLEEALRNSFGDLGLEISEIQVRKGVELYEQLRQRMGVNIVGPSGCGKTTLTTLLKSALGKLGQKIRQHTINPKAIPRHQLLGQIDLDTREWTNGVLTVAALHAVDEPEDVTTWIVCDGDVDPEWVESLNSVLDENRLLTLPSGWRIQFGPNTNFIFETHDLTHASPATVSRMAMIFLSDEDTNITGLVNSWIEKQDEEKKEVLGRLINEMFYKAIDWCVKTNDMVIETSMVGMVLNGLSHLEYCTNRLDFAAGLVKGLGGNLNTAARDSFAREIFKWCGENPPGRNPINVYYNKDKDRLDTYSNDVVSDFSMNSMGHDNIPIVSTADVKLTMAAVLPWLSSRNKPPFLLVGPEGIGKTLILRYCFSKLRSTNVATLHCSSNITPHQVIQKLSQVCLTVSSSNGRIFTPKECDRLVLYFKDLNLAKPDKYGTSMIISFLQQLITYNGFYDNNNEWIGLQDIQIVGSMTAGSGLGRHQLSTRFTSIIRVFSINEPDKEQLETIYSSYLYAVLKEIVPGHPVWANPGKVSSLASSMVNIYQQAKKMFSVDDNNHYLFTPRDLTRWFLGMMRYKIEDQDKSQNLILQIWAYEGGRIFRDKLVNDRDKSKFDSALSSILQSDWNTNASNQLQNLYFVTPGAVESSGGAMPSFGRPLAPISSADWLNYVDKGKKMFARESWSLNQYTTQEVLDLSARIDRALSGPGGSVLLAGRSGVGRRESLCVVSALHSARLVHLKMGKNFGIKQFKNDLKAVMLLSGVEEEQIFMVIEDQNLIEDQFLDLINSLLSSGEIPGLYSPEEMEPLLQPLKQNATNAGYSGDALSFFARNVKKNLHLALLMDCSSPDFVIRCESNPALYKECTILWTADLSPDTFISLPAAILSSKVMRLG